MSCVVADVESIEDRWDVCSLVLVKNVATLVRRKLLKLSRTLLLGRDNSDGWFCDDEVCGGDRKSVV